MTGALTHASFFSGVGGLDLGLERAGWRTVSFSEVDPYAIAVLARRWPDVPQLGDITALADAEGRAADHGGRGARRHGSEDLDVGDWRTATLWSGGFPCQDLSVAGKRRGMAGTRSVLAYAFLDLVALHRPRLVLLENVPGLLSSHAGRDMAALLGQLVQLGYGVGYRVLDAQHFGVPQRRRRVFIVGVSPGGRAGAERAAEVLSVGSRCGGHPPAGVEGGEGSARGVDDGVVGTFAAGAHPGSYNGQDAYNGFIVPVGPTDHAARGGTPDGLAGRLDGGGGLEGSPSVYVKARRASDGTESWKDGDVAPTINAFDGTDVRATVAAIGTGSMNDDVMLPVGLDSNRYRCCGNGVASDVAEWIGRRLAEIA